MDANTPVGESAWSVVKRSDTTASGTASTSADRARPRDAIREMAADSFATLGPSEPFPAAGFAVMVMLLLSFPDAARSPMAWRIDRARGPDCRVRGC